MVYFLLLGITFIAAVSMEDIPFGEDRRTLEGSQIYVTLYDFLLLFVFVILAFRSSSIGVDTANYINKFLSMQKYSSYFEYNESSTVEPLFYFVNRLIGYFNSDGRGILFAEGIIVLVGYGNCFRKLALNRYISLLAFISLGLFGCSLDLLRQTIAVSLCAWNLCNAIERKPFKFLLVWLISVGFHYTAIFFLPVFLICNIKSSRKTGLFIFTISVFASFFVERIQAFTATLVDRWDHYSNIETGAQGYIAFTIFLLITVMAFYLQDEISEEGKYAEAILNLNYCHLGFWVLRLITRNAERLAFYYMIGPVLLIPLLFKAVEKRWGENNAKIVRIVACIFLALYFIYKLLRTSDWYPYSFW